MSNGLRFKIMSYFVSSKIWQAVLGVWTLAGLVYSGVTLSVRQVGCSKSELAESLTFIL